MSQENNNKPRNEGGQRRQGNNNNRNRNRNRNNQGGGNQGGNRQGGQGRQSGGGPKNPQRRRQSRPMPLTTWEKVLKFFGLYKEPTRPPRRQSSGDKATESGRPQSAKKTAKSNTRNAQGRGDKKEKRNFPVETPRLYLGNLSYDADESSLEELFKGVGTVRSVEIVYNRHTHRSKGFGFIEMQNVDEAKRAVEELHDQSFMGRNLVVNGANNKPKEDRPPRESKPREDKQRQDKPREDKPRENKPRDRKPAQERGEKRNNPARLHLDNLSFDADESAIEDLFKGIGNVRRVELVYNRQTHKSKGFGFIEMQKAEDAQRAIEVLHDQPFMGRKLVVAEAKNKTQREDKPAVVEAAETPAAEEAAPQIAEEVVTETAPIEVVEEAPAAEQSEEPTKTTAE